MATVLGFKYESVIEPGSALIAGSADGLVDLPGAAGAGSFAGVFSASGNGTKEKPDTLDSLGLTVHGLCKVKAAGAVTAFAFGKQADALGGMGVYVPAVGEAKVAGFFVESGADGEIVDFFVQPFLHPGA